MGTIVKNPEGVGGDSTVSSIANNCNCLIRCPGRQRELARCCRRQLSISVAAGGSLKPRVWLMTVNTFAKLETQPDTLPGKLTHGTYRHLEGRALLPRRRQVSGLSNSSPRSSRSPWRGGA